MNDRRLRTAAPVLSAAALGALLWPAPALAHLVTTGLGPVYDGIGHLLLTPEDLVPALAFALYAGLRGPAAGRRVVFLLPAAWFAGGLAGLALQRAPAFPVAAVSFVAAGGLVAADLRLPTAAVMALAVALGLLHGALDGAALHNGAGLGGLVGIMAMIFILVTMTAALVASLKRPAARIAVRVAGSWIAAMGLLMFGWALR
jgi:hydrogenase/urease accessory protein HupE